MKIKKKAEKKKRKRTRKKKKLERNEKKFNSIQSNSKINYRDCASYSNDLPRYVNNQIPFSFRYIYIHNFFLYSFSCKSFWWFVPFSLSLFLLFGILFDNIVRQYRSATYRSIQIIHESTVAKWEEKNIWKTSLSLSLFLSLSFHQPHSIQQIANMYSINWFWEINFSVYIATECNKSKHM